MALDIPPSMCHIVWNFRLPSSRPASTTMGAQATGNNGDIEPLLDIADNAWQQSFLNGQDNSMAYVGVYILYNSGGNLISGEKIVNLAGGAALTTPPPNWALLVKKVTGFAGRAHRGRMYIPCRVGEGDIDESGAVTTGLATLQNEADALYSQLVGPTSGVQLLPVVLHTQPSIGSAPLPTAISSLQVVSMGSTQRRRMR